MSRLVPALVAVVAVVLLSVGPVQTAPVVGVLLALCAISAAMTASDARASGAPSGASSGGASGAPSSGVGDEPGPLRP